MLMSFTTIEERKELARKVYYENLNFWGVGLSGLLIGLAGVVIFGNLSLSSNLNGVLFSIFCLITAGVQAKLSSLAVGSWIAIHKVAAVATYGIGISVFTYTFSC
jgi:hypothetical protein